MNRQSPKLFQKVRVLDPIHHSDHRADILIVDDQIAAVETHLPTPSSETEVINAEALIFAPGLTDLYSHSGEPGHEERDTLHSLAAAAAAGGFTTLAILPDTHPAIDSAPIVQSLKTQNQLLKNSPEPKAQLEFWGALTLQGAGKQMAELLQLLEAGAIGFSNDQPLTDLSMLRRILEYLQPFNYPIAFTPADLSLRGNGVLREGLDSLRLGLTGDPAISETAALAAILEIVSLTQCPVHLMRISTQRGVELISQAKDKGLPITASTTWMHLLLDTTAAASYDPHLRLTPPLGNPSDRLALIDAVAEGVIDAIAIDHIGYTYEEKAVGFSEAPPGVIGLEFALPLLWQAFVFTGQWSALQLWQALSANPRRCLNQDPLKLSVGQPLNAVLFDPQKTWLVNSDTTHSLSTNSFWWGERVTGKVIDIWIP